MKIYQLLSSRLSACCAEDSTIIQKECHNYHLLFILFIHLFIYLILFQIKYHFIKRFVFRSGHCSGSCLEVFAKHILTCSVSHSRANDRYGEILKENCGLKAEMDMMLKRLEAEKEEIVRHSFDFY